MWQTELHSEYTWEVQAVFGGSNYSLLTSFRFIMLTHCVLVLQPASVNPEEEFTGGHLQ